MIYLRTTTDVYESARGQMDAARGLPSRGQITSFSPAAVAPKDGQARVLLALRESDLLSPRAADLLELLLASGTVEQVDRATYLAATNDLP